MPIPWPMFAAPVVAVLLGALLRKQQPHLYWIYCGSATFVLTSALSFHMERNPAPPFNTPIVLAAVLVCVPMLIVFAVERLMRSAPSFALAVGLGLLLYIPVLAISLTLAVQIGFLSP